MIHLSPSWSGITTETADSKFEQFIGTLGKELRTRVAYLMDREGRSKLGPIVPFHFHAALVSKVQIPVELIKRTWLDLMGRCNEATKKTDLVLVEPWDPNAGGMEYMLKFISDHDSSWDVAQAINLFNPRVPESVQFGRMRGRDRRRWNQQVAEAVAARTKS